MKANSTRNEFTVRYSGKSVATL